MLQQIVRSIFRSGWELAAVAEPRLRRTDALDVELELAGIGTASAPLEVRPLTPRDAVPLPGAVRVVSAPPSVDHQIVGKIPEQLRPIAFPRLEWRHHVRSRDARSLDASSQDVIAEDAAWQDAVGEDASSDDTPLEDATALEESLAMWSRPPIDCLSRFTRLADGSDESIAKFAARWGILSICDHGVPSSHDPYCRPLGEMDGGSAGWFGWEPIHIWRIYARRARAFLSIAAALRNDQQPSEADWRIIVGGPLTYAQMMPPHYDLLAFDPVSRRFGSTARHGEVLADYVTGWLDLAGLRPEMRWRAGDGVPHIELVPAWAGIYDASPSLFGTLAIQVAAALTSRTGLYRCTECKETYEPRNRRPRHDRDAYCPDCSANGAPKKSWARRSRTQRAVTDETSVMRKEA